MKKIIPVIIVVVVIIIAVVAIMAGGNKNNNSGNNSSSNSSKSTSTSSSSKTTAPVATDTVTILNYAFSPANITVKAGTTVTWTNKDAVGHTVTETDGKTGPNSADLNQNQTYSFTFTTAGTFHYNCSIHPYMVGSVTVTD